jgi:hypothetical protein
MGRLNKAGFVVAFRRCQSLSTVDLVLLVTEQNQAACAVYANTDLICLLRRTFEELPHGIACCVLFAEDCCCVQAAQASAA